MKRIDKTTHEVKTAGLGGNRQLLFDPDCRCGNIEDGVGFSGGRGWWVIPLDELQEMYKKAVEVRLERSPKPS